MEHYQVEGLKCPMFQMPISKDREGNCIVKHGKAGYSTCETNCQGFLTACEMMNYNQPRDLAMFQIKLFEQYASNLRKAFDLEKVE